MEACRSKLRDYHVPGEASAMTGAKLAALVCKVPKKVTAAAAAPELLLLKFVKWLC